MTEKKHEKADTINKVIQEVFTTFFGALTKADEDGEPITGCMTIAVTTGSKVKTICTPYCTNIQEFASLVKLSERALNKELSEVFEPADESV